MEVGTRDGVRVRCMEVGVRGRAFVGEGDAGVRSDARAEGRGLERAGCEGCEWGLVKD